MTKTKFEAQYDQCSTKRQRKLQNAADGILAKSGYFARKDEQRQEDEYVPVEADAISKGSSLRPTWQGRA